MKNSNSAIGLLWVLTLTFTSVEAKEDRAQNDSNNENRYAMQALINGRDSNDDLDQDGVLDRQDQCLNTSFGYAVDETGCEADTDRDSVLDRLDQCPYTPISMKVNFLGCEPDQDKDKVLDSLDECPNTPLGTKVDQVGCALPDLDGDGVLNGDDECPNTPKGTQVNGIGCALPSTFMAINIAFDTGSFNIKSDQKAHLNASARQLRQLEDNEIIFITGHTDDVGRTPRNENLSWNRAQSTKNYLMANFGHLDERIFILGEGELLPIATNETVKGRQANRRITFSIIPPALLPQHATQNIPNRYKAYIRFGHPDPDY